MAKIFYGYIFFCFFIISSCDIQKRHYRSGFYVGGVNDGAQVSIKNTSQNLKINLSQQTLVNTATQNKDLETRTLDEKVISKELKTAKKITFNTLKNKFYSLTKSLHKQKKAINSNQLKLDEIDFKEERIINRMSITAFVLGILAFPLTFAFVLPGLICAILAIVVANNALLRAKNYSRKLEVTNKAIAGKVLGIVYLSLILAALIVLIGFFVLVIIAL